MRNIYYRKNTVKKYRKSHSGVGKLTSAQFPVLQNTEKALVTIKIVIDIR